MARRPNYYNCCTPSFCRMPFCC